MKKSHKVSPHSPWYLLATLLLATSCTTRSIPLNSETTPRVVGLQTISLPEHELSDDTQCIIRDLTNKSQALIECDKIKGSEIVSQSRYTWSLSNGLTFLEGLNSREGRWITVQRLTHKGEIFGTVDTSFGSVPFIFRGGIFEYPHSPSSPIEYKAVSPNATSNLVERGERQLHYSLIQNGKEEPLPLDGYVVDSAVMNDNGDLAGGLSKVSASGDRGIEVGSSASNPSQVSERAFVLLRGSTPVILNTESFSRFDGITKSGSVIGTVGEGAERRWIMYTREAGTVDLYTDKIKKFIAETSFPTFVGEHSTTLLIIENGSNLPFSLYETNSDKLLDVDDIFRKSLSGTSLYYIATMNDQFEFIGVLESTNDKKKWDFFFAKIEGYLH